MGNNLSLQVLERKYLFPRRLSWLALGLVLALALGTATLVSYQHSSFSHVHREQLPLLEMASINVRLANSIEMQTGFLGKEGNAGLREELRANLDSLEFNLKGYREAIERNPALRPAALSASDFLETRREFLRRLEQGKDAEAEKLAAGPGFVKAGETFLGSLADATEGLSRSRDEAMAWQLRLIRGLALSFLTVGGFLVMLCARIYRTYRANFERRLAAEEQVMLLSQQRQQLIHVLCHDLGNPVASISGLIGYVEKFEGEPRRQAIAMIQSAAANAQGIIDLIRKLQALESGKLSLEMEPLSLRGLVEESLAVLKERLTGKKLEAAVEIAPELKVVVERTSFVNSVVNNVLTNAIKFSQEGSRIELHAHAEGEAVHFSVRDHGVGMPAALLETVFSELKATSRKGTSGEAGTGFGMPLVKKFVVAYGGKISVRSSEAAADHGTEIAIELKRAA